MAGDHHFSEFESKMRIAGLSDAAIDAFGHSYGSLLAGATGMIAESSIEPVSELPRLTEVARPSASKPPSPLEERAGERRPFSPNDLLCQTVIIKLNGGLGTSTGLERAKSLLPVKEGLTFLDFIVKQILDLRHRFNVPLRFLLMNSFSTSADTLKFLRRYAELGDPGTLELLQNQVPKVD